MLSGFNPFRRAQVRPAPPAPPLPKPSIYNPDDVYSADYLENDDVKRGIESMYDTRNSSLSLVSKLTGLTQAQENNIRQGALGPFFREGAPPVKPIKVDEEGFMDFNEVDIDESRSRFLNENIRRKVQNKVAHNMAIIIDYRLTILIDRQRDLDVLNLVARNRRVGEELPHLSPQSKRLQGSINAALTYYENMNKPEETRLYKALTEFNEEIVNLIMTGIAYIGDQRFKNFVGDDRVKLVGPDLDIQTNDDLFEISEYLAHKLYSYLKVELRSGTRKNWDRHLQNSTVKNYKWNSDAVSLGKTFFGRLGKLNPLGGIRKEQLTSIRGRTPYPIPTEEQIIKYRLSKNALNKGGFSLTKNAYHRHAGFFNQIASLVRNVIRISIGIPQVNGAAPRNTSKRGDLGSYGPFEDSKNKFEYGPSEYDYAGDGLTEEFSLRGAKNSWRAARDAAEKACAAAVDIPALEAALRAPGASVTDPSSRCAGAQQRWKDLTEAAEAREAAAAVAAVRQIRLNADENARRRAINEAEKLKVERLKRENAQARRAELNKLDEHDKEVELARREVAGRARKMKISEVEYLGGTTIEEYAELNRDERTAYDNAMFQRRLGGVLGQAAAAPAAPAPAAAAAPEDNPDDYLGRWNNYNKPPAAPGGGARTRRRHKTKKRKTRRRH